MLRHFAMRMQRAIWPGTIRVRLLLMVAVAALLLTGFRLAALHNESNLTLLRARVQASELARTGVVSGLDAIEQVRMSLDILSQVPVLAAGKAADCSALLTDVHKTRSWSAGLFVLDNTGTVVCSSLPEDMGLNFADRPYVQKAIAGRRFVAGDFMLGRGTGTPMIGSAMPVYDRDNELRRVLVATITTKWFTKLATDLASGNHGSSITLIDGTGIILADAPESADRIGAPLASESMRDGLLTMRGTSFEAVGSDGEARIYGVASMPDSNALVIVGLSRAAVKLNLDRARLQTIVDLSMLIGLLTLLIWTFGEFSIEKPIRRLLDQARHIGRGRLDARLDGSSWPRELAMLAQTMNHMSMRLERRDNQLRAARDKLRQQALTDPLTGLANRRSFEDRLSLAWVDAHAAGASLSLVIVDVDHFKKYNDSYGHEAGDAVLKTLGHVLAKTAESAAGFAARLGGEEFALLLPGSGEVEGLALADQVCASVRDLDMAHDASDLARVTVSAGVAGLVPQGRVVDRLLLRSADAALYAAKASGRDRAMGNARLRELATPGAGTDVLDLAG